MENTQATQPQAPQGPTKTCKHCKSTIPKGAKVCPYCRKKQSGKGKTILIVIIVIIVIAAIGSGNNSSSSNDNSSIPASNNNTNTNVASTESFSEKEVSGLTEEKFNKIETGMSYDEVVAIIGEDGTNISESEVAGIKTVIYEWTSSEKWGNANITFQDGKVINKAQFGVSSGDDIEITMEQYNAVQTGMSYDEVVAILGGEGSLLSDTEIAGSKSQIYMWNGNSFGANANITFSDGKVISKAQVGLQ